MKILKIIIRFYVSFITIISLLCLAYAIYFKPMLKDTMVITGSFIRQQLLEHQSNIKFPINPIYLFSKHLKFLMFSRRFEDKYSLKYEYLNNFKINFPQYNQLNLLFEELFMKKEYYFQSKKSDPLIIDCGSNIGMSILFFKTLYPNSKIIGFEPSQQNFDFLEKNITDNNLTKVTLHKKALSNCKSELKLYNPGSVKSSTTNDNSTNSDYEIVESTFLSDYITENVELLKLDIEGAETKVIKNLNQKNKLGLINQIIMEYHYPSEKNKLSKMLKTLEENKFHYHIKSNIRMPLNNQSQDEPYLIYAYRK